MLRRLGFLLIVLAVFFVPLGVAVGRHFADEARVTDWRSARHDTSGQAPPAASTPEAVIQVYGARAFGWRGAFGVHTWLAVKPQGAARYTRLEVIGWGVRRGMDAVRVWQGVPDAHWYGNRPMLLRDVRGGAAVDALIDRLLAAAASYPHIREYRMWPGPNSNTFIAYLGREVPELRLDLPSTAIGKDYLPEGALLSTAPSGGGVQLSVGGLLGIIAAPQEGVEINLLGLSVGVDLSPPAIKLPGIGRIGAAQARLPTDDS